MIIMMIATIAVAVAVAIIAAFNNTHAPITNPFVL